jgi:hypothetical protein
MLIFAACLSENNSTTTLDSISFQPSSTLPTPLHQLLDLMIASLAVSLILLFLREPSPILQFITTTVSAIPSPYISLSPQTHYHHRPISCPCTFTHPLSTITTMAAPNISITTASPMPSPSLPLHREFIEPSITNLQISIQVPITAQPFLTCKFIHGTQTRAPLLQSLPKLSNPNREHAQFSITIKSNQPMASPHQFQPRQSPPPSRPRHHLAISAHYRSTALQLRRRDLLRVQPPSCCTSRSPGRCCTSPP